MSTLCEVSSYIKYHFKTNYLPNVTIFYNRFKEIEGEERQEKGKVPKEKEQTKAIRCVSDQSDPI